MKYEVKSAEWAFLKTIVVFIFYFVVSIIDNTDCFSVCNGHFEYRDGVCICQDAFY